MDANNKYKHYLWKGHFINDLFNAVGFEYYLELGISKSETYKNVNAMIKSGVDSDPNINIPGVINTSTDFFFHRNSLKFDLIYIDACHEKMQVAKDFSNSFRFLNKNGIILFHDINPINKSNTNADNSGNVFELWINMCNTYKMHCFVSGHNNDALGVFLLSENQTYKKPTQTTHTFEYFNENRSKYINNIDVNFKELINIYTEAKND